MKLGLIGYGKMGQGISEAAQESGHEVTAIVASGHPSSMASDLRAELVDSCDVCIDYTHPSVVVDHIKQLASLGKDMVVGTTGWEEYLPEVKSCVEAFGVGLIYAPNFSIGVHLFHRLVQHAAGLFNGFEEYDVSVQEVHHRHKVDCPSGTALSLARLLVEELDRKESIHSGGPLESNQLQVCSSRVGEVPGEHAVLFDAKQDTICLTHTARSRAGFIVGTLRAAEWVQGRRGVFTLDDMLR